MADPDPADDWLVIESFARWAGDTALARDSLSKAKEAQADKGKLERLGKSDRVPRALMAWAEYRSSRTKISRRELAHQDQISRAEPIDPQPIEQKPISPFLQGRSLRAVASMVTSREFELRGYPINLEAVEDILKRASDAERRFAAAGRVEGELPVASPHAPAELFEDSYGKIKTIRATGASWTMPGRLLRFVWVDAFALIFVRATWTPDEPVKNIGEVYNLFREVLSLLD